MAKKTSRAAGIRNRIAKFSRDIKKEIIDQIVSVVAATRMKRIDMEDDGYHGYPVIYDDKDCCSVLEFRGVMLTGPELDKPVIIREDGMTSPLKKYTSFELLQMLDYLEKTI